MKWPGKNMYAVFWQRCYKHTNVKVIICFLYDLYLKTLETVYKKNIVLFRKAFVVDVFL